MSNIAISLIHYEGITIENRKDNENYSNYVCIYLLLRLNIFLCTRRFIRIHLFNAIYFRVSFPGLDRLLYHVP